MNIRFGNILLRPVESTDLALLQKLYNDPDLNTDTMGWDFPVSMDKQLEWFSTIKHDKSTFRAMIECETGETVGAFSLSNIDYKNRTASVNGAKVLQEYQNKGYAQEAALAMMHMVFDYLDFYAIEVQHLETQTVTQHLLKKLGFVHEGTLRKRIYKNGDRLDLLVWSMTAGEFRSLMTKLKYTRDSTQA